MVRNPRRPWGIPLPYAPRLEIPVLRRIFLLALGLSVSGCAGEDPVSPGDPVAGAGASNVVILEGTIRRFTTDQLLGGVIVNADQDAVTSTEKGSYTFTDLGEGEVQIRATYPGFLPYAAKQRLQPGRNRHDIELVPERQR